MATKRKKGPGSGAKRRRPPFIPAEDREMYERQPDESDPAFEAFVKYRDAGLSRSQVKVAKELGKSPVLIARWGSRWGWRARVESWDIEQDKASREADLKAIMDMRKRHIQIGSMMQGLGVNELKKSIRRSQSNQDDNTLTADQAQRLVDLGMKIERLNRGEPDSIQQDNVNLSLEDKRQQLRTYLGDPDIVDALRRISKKTRSGVK